MKEETDRKNLFAATDDMIKTHNNNPSAPFKLVHNQFSIMESDLKNYSSLVHIDLKFNYIGLTDC